MAHVSIVSESDRAHRRHYRAVAAGHESVGKTAGEALDALIQQLGDNESSALIVVQQMQPDRFFSQSQYDRLRDLLDRRPSLTDRELLELEELVKEELAASARRAEAAASVLGR